MDAGEGETARFHCRASGIPVPDHFWFINGTPIASKILYKNVDLIVEQLSRLTYEQSCSFVGHNIVTLFGCLKCHSLHIVTLYAIHSVVHNVICGWFPGTVNWFIIITKYDF